MKKMILLAFDIPRDKASLRVKVWRELKKMNAKSELGSLWALPFNKENLLCLRLIAKEIRIAGGGAKIIIGEEMK